MVFLYYRKGMPGVIKVFRSQLNIKFYYLTSYDNMRSSLRTVHQRTAFALLGSANGHNSHSCTYRKGSIIMIFKKRCLERALPKYLIMFFRRRIFKGGLTRPRLQACEIYLGSTIEMPISSILCAGTICYALLRLESDVLKHRISTTHATLDKWLICDLRGNLSIVKLFTWLIEKNCYSRTFFDLIYVIWLRLHNQCKKIDWLISDEPKSVRIWV